MGGILSLGPKFYLPHFQTAHIFHGSSFLCNTVVCVPNIVLIINTLKKLFSQIGRPRSLSKIKSRSREAALQAPVVQWMFNGCSGVMFNGRVKICFNV